MVPADRKQKLREIRQRLKDGLPCRVVATSLIEAGVDVDFPNVLREEAGLNSILQAAGRCNREASGLWSRVSFPYSGQKISRLRCLPPILRQAGL